MHTTTSPPRERGRRGHRSGDEEYVLYLQGIPQHCRWQELKDFVRQTALHIRQAVVYDDQHGYPTGLGQIIVKNEDEAWRTYRKLSATGWDGHPLTVTLAKASSPTRPIAGPTKSSSSSGHTLPYRGKVGRHSIAGTPTPESPVTTEPIQSHSIAAGTIYTQYIPPCTPTGHSNGHIQGFSPLADPPGYGHHHHHPHAAGWHPDEMGMLTFPLPPMTMFPPPAMEQQQIEYPCYFPYSHPMQIPVRSQPIYAEMRYPDYQQQPQHQIPSAFFNQYLQASNQYYGHQQQGYHIYGSESRKPSFYSSSTSETYPNTATAPYSNDRGILPTQALPQGIRHVIIDNIRPGIDIQTIQDHFSDAGNMLQCQIIRYNHSNENSHEARYNELSYPGQCYATATFSTAEEAKRAEGMYNGSDLGGNRVVVRLDTEYDPSSGGFEEGNGIGNGDGGRGESDWSRSQSYSLSFTTSDNALLASSVSSSTATSLGTFSAYSESPNSQLSSISGNKTYHHHHPHQHRDRRDSGKEILKTDNHPFLPPQSAQSDCVDNTSSRSVSPTSGEREAVGHAEEKSRTTTMMQPLVVNGSGPVRRAKM